MTLKELLEVVNDGEYFRLYVIGEDFYVFHHTDKDDFGILDKTDKEIKPYLNCRVTSITATPYFEGSYILVYIARAEE